MLARSFKSIVVAMSKPLLESWITVPVPVVVRGALFYKDLDLHVISAHLDLQPCHLEYPVIVQTSEKIWASISKRTLQIEEPTPIHKKISTPPSETVNTLYTPKELTAWEEFSNFPAFQQAHNQKILNSFCI